MATAYLRFEAVRDAYRLIGECRDLGSDPALWQLRMMEGLSRLLDAPASGGEGVLTATSEIVPLTFFDSGFDADARSNYLGYVRDGGPTVDPFVRALRQIPGSTVTRNRRQIVGDAEYSRAPLFDRYLRPGNIDHRLASVFASVDQRIFLIHLHRSRRERDFSPRDRALLEFFHHEIGPLVGRALVSAAEPSPEALPRRLRQALACLVEGDSEKQLAARLGVSHATAHQYVTALYRRFGVNSRGQLLAHVVKRLAQRKWLETIAAAGRLPGGDPGNSSR